VQTEVTSCRWAAATICPRPGLQLKPAAAALSQAGRAGPDHPIRAIQPAGRTRRPPTGCTPRYLCDDCQHVSDVGRRRLRSSDVSTCMVPRTHTGFGDRAFQVAGPRLWNSLPASLRQSDTTVGQFKKLLKTHLLAETAAH